jgi:hypothetical protein
MSKIFATDDFNTGTWSLNIEDLAFNYADMFITFTETAPVVVFDNLSFGYELTTGDTVVQTNSFPPEGVNYVQSDQPYLVCERLLLEMETTYSLFLWCVNGGNRFEKDFSFTTPRPTQPFASWTWDSSNLEWVSPTPYPDDGNLYDWDEDTTSWVED